MNEPELTIKITPPLEQGTQEWTAIHNAVEQARFTLMGLKKETLSQLEIEISRSSYTGKVDEVKLDFGETSKGGYLKRVESRFVTTFYLNYQEHAELKL